jgi:hypothetical protein
MFKTAVSDSTLLFMGQLLHVPLELCVCTSSSTDEVKESLTLKIEELSSGRHESYVSEGLNPHVNPS